MPKLKARFTDDRPLTIGRFLTTYVPVILTIAIASVAGITALAQIVNDVESLEERQLKEEHTLETIRQVQSEHGAVLRGLAVQNAALTRTQERIWQSLERVHSKLDDASSAR